MKEETPSMALHHSSAESESDDQNIPSHQPLLHLKNPHLPEEDDGDDHMDQEQEGLSLSTHNHDFGGRDNNGVSVTQRQITPSASKPHLCNKEKIALHELVSLSPPVVDVTKETVEAEAQDSGRERLKRHRVEVAGRVWIPDMWGQEELLKDWIDCAAFDAPLVPSRIMTARAALVEECRRTNAGGLGIENRC